MNAQTERFTIDGPVGAIEIAIDRPAGAPRGITLVAHPHPLFGGTLDNKVAQTLARAFVQLGYAVVRPNFRGVGKSTGEHDNGFSFGTFVLSHVAKTLEAAGTAAQRLVFVGTAASNWEVATVPADTLVIHGELDDTVPLQSVLDWARPQTLPVVVIPGGEHFFHGLLPLLKQLVVDAWRH